MSPWCLLSRVKLFSWNRSAQVGCVSQVHLLDLGAKFNSQCDKLCYLRRVLWPVDKHSHECRNIRAI